MTNTEAPKMIKVYARDMYAAQGFTLSTEQRAQLVAGADKFREITGTTAKTSMSVDVLDVYTHQLIGRLTYRF